MLSWLALPLLLLVGCTVSAGSNSAPKDGGIECPDLHPSVFCSDEIPRDFEYSDGCSRYRCGFIGYSIVTSASCPRAESLADQRRCRSVSRAVFSRLERRACPNAAPQQVCASVRGVGGSGHRYTDGCNRFGCAADGSVAGSTRLACPTGNARSAYCSFIVNMQNDALLDFEDTGSNRSDTSSGSGIECPDLHPSVFCSDEIPRNFEYSDGCSRYRCGFMGYSIVTSASCPRAESLADQRRCRSVSRAVFNRLEPQACPNSAPALVCASVRDVGGSGLRYTDGCNRFACAADGSVAGSTWRTCSQGNARSTFCSFIVSSQHDALEENAVRDVSVTNDVSGIECPDLHPSVFCSDEIPRDFEYSDGCSRYRCGFMSYSIVTSASCPRAESLADHRRCRSVSRVVFSRLEPRACPNAAPQQVCASVRGIGGSGLRYTDGCNRFGCAADGSVAGSTWRTCSLGNARSTVCSFIVSSQIEALADNATADVPVPSDGPGIECPDLHPSVFCSDEIPRNFEYSDGCSRYRCGFISYSIVTSASCPRAESLADQRRCRSVSRAVFNRLEPRACPNAAPAEVCGVDSGTGVVGDADRLFTDGCNHFACAADGSVAGSTWRTCPQGNSRSAYCTFFNTDTEDGPII